MTVSSQPLKLDHFLEQLRNCSAMKEHLKSNGHKSFENFSEDEIIDYIDDAIQNDSDEEMTMEALGAYEDVFDVTILGFGDIVYWVRANEFDDIKYFSSRESAADYAHNEYHSYIVALNTLNSEHEDS